MILKESEIPAVVMRAFKAGLGNYIDPSNPLWSLLLKQYVALPWWSLSLSEIGKLDKPKFKEPITRLDHLVISTGWRFMAAEANRYGGCHVGSIENGSPILTGFSDDPQILTFMESLEQLKSISRTGQYTLRVLRVAWLHFESFWLSTPDGAGDIVIPFSGFIQGPPNHLSLMNPYPVGSFLEAIWCRALEVGARENQRKALDHGIKATAVQAQADAHTVSATVLAQKAKEQSAAYAALCGKTQLPAPRPHDTPPPPDRPVVARAAPPKKRQTPPTRKRV